ncbi:hypothetical protein JNB62_18540 [Microbacterium jejuense]|uniref:Uncharacterized protein n=2 Tax=Microbacterium jejuense TaxID=1263637 RepID=A0ABS7HSP4_9MICO|nr:hypothetical protein [Microbacterium jejuense]
MATAGLLALDLARGTGSVTRADVEAALGRAEGHHAKVAVDVVPQFVRAVLERAAVPSGDG